MAETFDLCYSNFLKIAKFLKIKRISDESTRENGKKYYKIEWEDTWAEESELLKANENVIKQYLNKPKPKIEIFAHSENREDNTQVILLRVPSNFVNNTQNGNISIDGYHGAALIDHLDEERKKKEQQRSTSLTQEISQKALTYSQLEKVGFLDEEEEIETSHEHQTITRENYPTNFMNNSENNPNSMTSAIKSSHPSLELELGPHRNLNDGNTRFLDYGIMSASMVTRTNSARRVYASRRRQPYQMYKCDLCSSEFVHRTHLAIHKRTHTGEKPYKCEYCGRGFAQKGNLHVHQKIHTGEKDFICEICHRAFITNAQLFVHMRTHTKPNKKRPHVTGRPVKHIDPPIKKEIDNEARITKTSMENILGQLASAEVSDARMAANSIPSQQISPNHTHSELSQTLPNTNDLCNLQEMASPREYIGNLHTLPAQSIHQSIGPQQQSGVGKIGKNHHPLMMSSSLQNIHLGTEPLYTMHDVSVSGLVTSQGDCMVQLVVAQP